MWTWVVQFIEHPLPQPPTCRTLPELVCRAVPPLRLINCSGACHPLLPPDPTDSKLSCSGTSRLLRPMSESFALYVSQKHTCLGFAAPLRQLPIHMKSRQESLPTFRSQSAGHSAASGRGAQCRARAALPPHGQCQRQSDMQTTWACHRAQQTCAALPHSATMNYELNGMATDRNRKLHWGVERQSSMKSARTQKHQLRIHLHGITQSGFTLLQRHVHKLVILFHGKAPTTCLQTSFVSACNSKEHEAALAAHMRTTLAPRHGTKRLPT